MDPENQNPTDPTTGEEDSAVVVDLTETDAEKMQTPLTDDKSGDKGGDKDDKTQAADDDGGDDDDGYEDRPITGNKKHDKRLRREMRAKLQARAEAATANEQLELVRQENARLKAERTQAEPLNTTDIDLKLTKAQTDLAAAIEAGNSTDQARLNVEIASLTSERAQRLAAPRRLQQDPTQQRQQQQVPKQNGMSATGRAFVEANADWWDDPQKSAERAAIVAIDNQLIRAGSDPNSETHYQRIAKRAKAMGMRLDIKQPFDDEVDVNDETTVDLNEDDRRERRRTPPMGGNGNTRQRVNSEVRDARAGKVVLDEAAKANMRTFKLDPANPMHVKAYAKARQERILQEAGQ